LRLRLLPALVAIGVLLALIPGAPAQAATQVPVLTSSNGEFQPARSDTGLAWEQNTRAQPKHYDAIYRSDGGPTIQVNQPGSGAAMGDIAGGKVIYQQYKGTLYTRRGRSDIYSYDIATGARSKVPGVNSKRWEYWPSMSGPWVLFARHKVVKNKEIRWLFLRNLDTGEQLRLDRVKAKIKRRFFIGPGQVNGNYVVWSACKPRCEVYRFDLITRTTQVITNPGAYQRAPSVTPGGTVYFSRGGKGCGDSVSLVRAAPDGSQEVMVQLQTGLDIFDTYSHMAPSGVTEVYYERDVCGQPAGGDIYKILDPELAGLTVNLVGSGSGTVTSSPVGINCEPDCAHDYPGGASVTLQAQPDPDSYFAGWTGACTGTGACTVTMDGAKNVTAMFELAGTITIVKDALPDATDDFQFTTTGGLSPSSFILDDDDELGSPSATSNTQSFTGLRAGTYTVTESNPPSGWQRAGIACVEDGIQNTTFGVTLASIQVEPGEEVTCTFTNAQDGTISVRKDALPDDGQDFRFDPSWQTADFFLDDDGNEDPLSNAETFTGLATGQTYTVFEENIPANWQLTDISCVGGGPNTSDAGVMATIGLDPGEAVVCTFTNQAVGSITVVKDAQPNHPQDFSFTATGLTPSAFTLDDDPVSLTPTNQQQFPGVNAGVTYTITEEPDPAGWQLDDITCVGGGGNTSDTGRTATIGLDPGENVTCTFVNQGIGSITVIKDAIPSNGQDFTFSSTGGLTPSTFTLDDDADPANSNQQVFLEVNAGSYTVTEGADPPGWLLTDITCAGGGPNTSDAGRTATIGLDPGESVTCTFTNQGVGSITVVKDAQPNSAQDFAFTAGGGLSPAGFNLDDDGDGTLSNQQIFSNVPAGVYSVTEGSDPAGWQLTDITCAGGGGNTTDTGRTATIGLDPGETIACTFTNTQEATITVVKDAQPNHPQDFSFTTTGGLAPPTFNLDDDADPGLANARTFTDLLPGNYTVSEGSDPAGWILEDIACTGGGPNTTDTGRTATIGLDPGESVVCTFTNQGQGSITVVKNALPNDAQNFSYTTTGGLTPSTFSLDDDDDPALLNQQVFSAVNAGSYTVTEGADPTGWQLTDLQCTGGGANTSTASRTASIGLDPGESVTCTFTNTQESTITIVKDAVNNSPQDFSFTATGLTSPAFNLDDDADGTLSNEQEFGDLLPQTYTVTEGADPAGWQLTDITCAGGGPNTTDTGRTATIGLDPGENVTCTFTNTQEGTITVVKDAVNDAPQDFSFTTTGGLTPPTFSLDDDADGTLSDTQVFGDLLPGEFTVSEAADPPGWQLTDITCAGGGSDTTETARTATIGLDPGENVTCTFTNTEEGSITIVKDAQPNDPQDFSFTTTGGLTPPTFDLDDDADGTLSNTRAFNDLLPGAFTVTEGADPSGWSLTNLQCTGGGADTTTAGHTATIGLAPGEAVTCTFTNSGVGTITIVKDAVDNSAQDFPFTTTGGLSPSAFNLDDDGSAPLSNQQVFTNVAAGLYSVTEGADPTGWQLTNLQCIGGGLDTTTAGRTATIGLDPGENVTCTYTNTEEGSITIVKDAQPDGAQDFEFDPSANHDPGTNFLLDDDADGTLSAQRTFTGLLPGTYAVDEVNMPGGWNLTSTSCTDSSAPGVINLGPGEDVTCTFTNTMSPNPPTISESFNKSDGAGLGPNLSWTDFHGVGWSTTGGQAYVPQGPEAPFIARANQDLGSADHYAEAPLALNPNGDGQAGVAVRCSSSAITCYFGLVSGNGTTPNMIGKMVEGVVTILTSENDPTGAGGVVRLEIVGSQLTLRVNGAVELAATDTEITTGTRTGVAGATEPGAARWSSFAAGTL
jgi:plastocyanin